MKQNLLIIFLVAIFIPGLLQAGDEIESIYNRIDTAAPKTKVVLYNQLASKITGDSLSESLGYALKALDLSGTINWPEGQATSRLTLAKIQISASYLPESFENADKAAKLFSDLAFPAKAADAKLTAATAAREMNKLDTAEKYYKSAIEIYARNGDKFNSAYTRLELGKLLSMKDSSPKTIDMARQYIKDAIALFLNESKPVYIAESYIGYALSFVGDNRESHAKDSSIKYYEKAREIFGEHKESFDEAGFYLGYADMLKSLGDLRAAGSYYEKSLAIYKSKNDIEGQKEALHSLYLIAERSGSGYSIKLALDYLERYSDIVEQQLSESIKRSDLEKKVSMEELQRKRVERELSKVETEKRLTELQREKAKSSERQLRTFSITMTIIVALLIFIAVILVKFYNEKKISNELLASANNKLSEANKNLAEKSAKIEKQNKIIEHDLSKASDYVRSILPKVNIYNNIRTDWKFIPSALLGGDLFGYEMIDPENFMFYLIDVAGHGVKSALYSVSVGNVLNYRNLPGVDFRDPVEVFQGLNSAFQMKDHSDLFFTIWYGVYNTSTKVLKYSSAGHPPALLFDGKEFHRLSCENFLIGGLKKFPFTSHSIVIEQSTQIILYSDGAYEILKDDGEYWTMEEFAEKIGKLYEQDECTPERIFAEIRSLAGKNSLDDDFSILKININ